MQKAESIVHGQIQRFVSGLRSKTEDTRWSTYRELRKYVNVDLREASSEELVAFVDDFYNQLKDLGGSGDINDRKAWILATRNLIAIDYAGKYQVAFSNTVRLLAQGTTDTSMLELLAGLVGQLALRAGTMTTDYVQSELSRCAEFLEQSESKRLFALFTYRQLAQVTPTLFFQNVQTVFEGVFSALRDARAPIREQAAVALRAAFRVCSQREVTRKEKKERPRWYAHCFAEFERTFNDIFETSLTGGSSQLMQSTSGAQQRDAAKRIDKQKVFEDYVHGELLIILELLRVANADTERTIHEMETAPNEFDVGSATRAARANVYAPNYDPFGGFDVDDGDTVTSASALSGSHTRSLVADLLRKSSISQVQRAPSGSTAQAAGELAALAPSGGFSIGAGAVNTSEHDENVPHGGTPSSAPRFHESRTCAALWADKFDLVCDRVLSEFRLAKQLASQLLILETLPRLAAFNPQKFAAPRRLESAGASVGDKDSKTGANTSYLQETMIHLLSLLNDRNRDAQLERTRDAPLRNAAFNCVGLIALFVRDSIRAYLRDILGKVIAALQSGGREPQAAPTRRHNKGLLSNTNTPATPVGGNVQVEAEVFNCIRMLAIAVGSEEEFCGRARDLLDKMMLVGLSPAFTASLRTLAKSVPLTDFRKEVQTVLLKTLSLILTGAGRQPKTVGTAPPGVAKSTAAPGMQPGAPGATNEAEGDVRNVMLALKTLGNFDLEGFSLTHFVRHIADQYLAFDNKQIRLETALTCCKLLTPLLTSNEPLIHAGQSRSAVHTISEVLSRLITVATTDPEADIRRAVLLSLGPRFDGFLAQSENLNALFVALNDEHFEIRELALCTVGRLSAINPAQVLPFLRKSLVQMVTEFEDSGSARNQEQSARLLGHLVYTCPVLVRSYMEQLIGRLVPRLRGVETAAPVSTAIMLTIGQLAIVSTDGLENWTRELLPVIIDMLQDSASPQRREVAVWTLGQLVANTGTVAEPYRMQPQLLDILLNVFRVEQSLPMRRETIHVLGLLGALDPFRHKQLKGELDRVGAETDDDGRRRAPLCSTARRATTSTAQRDPTALVRHTHAQQHDGETHATAASGPGVGAAAHAQTAGGQNEQETLIGLAASSLEDFYAMTAICAMMRVICDPSLHQHHVAAITACSQVFRSLGSKCDTYVHQVVPTYLSVLRSADSDATLRDQLFKQLGTIIKLVRTQIRPYLEDVLSAMRDYWTVVPAQLNIIELLSQTAKALDYELRPYLFMIMPNVLRVLVSPKASTASIEALLSVIQEMGAHLDDYLHILLPPITRLLDAPETPPSDLSAATPASASAQMAVKTRVLETLECLAQATDVGDYASLIVQALVRFVDRAPTPELRSRAARTFTILATQLGRRFMLFVGVTRKTFARHRVDAREFELLVQRLARTNTLMADSDAYDEPPVATLSALRRTAGTSQSDAETTQIRKYPFEAEKLRTACACDTSQMVSREDWTEWLRGLTFGVLRDSPSPALRACASPAHAYQPLARQVFNAAFLSCWSELDESNPREREVRDAVVRSLETALVASDASSGDAVPEIVLTILNLAEFMEHTEKGALPLRASLLADKAIRCRAYAKALHFKETEFREHLARLKERSTAGGGGNELPAQSSTQLEALLESLITINNKLQQSEAAHGVLQYALSRNVRVQPSWYEKLHSWQKALDAYDEHLTQLIMSNAGVNERDALTSEQREQQLTFQIGRLRCLDALAEWNAIDEMVSSNWSRSSDFQMKSARQAASAAWGRAEWNKFEKYTLLIAKDTYDGLFYRAVHAVNARHFGDAVTLIAKARDILDTELTAVVAESYSRAYSAMINVQMLSELEEVIEYKLVPERGALLKLSWFERLNQCQSVVEDCQRFLQIRSLVITPQDDARTWLKFAALCRKNARWSLAYNTLHSLLAPGATAFVSSSPTTPASGLHPSPSAPAFIQSTTGTGQAIALNSQSTLFSATSSTNLSTQFAAVQNAADAIRNAIYSNATTLTSSLPAQVVYQYAKCRWQEDVSSATRKDAITILQFLATAFYESRRLSSRVERSGANSDVACAMFAPNGERLSPRDAQHLLAKVFVHLGLWHETLDGGVNNDRNLQVVLNFYATATERDPSWYKAWHLLALTNYEALLYCNTLLRDPTNASGESLARPNTSTSSETSATVSASVDQPVVLGDAAANSANAAADGTINYMPSMRKYCVTAIRGFVRSIGLSRRNALQDILRLVTLWFDFCNFQEAYDALKDGIATIEIEHWLQVIPQIIARIDTARMFVTELVTQLLCEIGRHHPQALIYPLTVASKSNSTQRQLAASRILQSLCEHSNMLVKQALLISEELIRVAILWHELWHERLEEASRLYFGEHSAEGMISVLAPLHEMIVRGWQTMKEHSFTVQYARELSEAWEWCKKYEHTHNPKDIGQAWELYYQVFKRISKQLPQLNALELTSVSPKLLRVHDYELAVPGTYSPGRPVVRIKGVKPNLQVISSKQRPRKLSIFGSDGHEYQFLLKGHEDLRQDERVMQLFGLVNSLLLENAETNRRNLTIRRMAVVPLSTNSGLIGWLHNCDTLHSLIRDYRDKKKILLNIEHRLMLKLAPDYEHLTLLQKVEIFGQALENTEGDDLQRILWYKSPNSETWFERRYTYTRSLAVMSMVGYVLGLGDRHPSNLMLDRLSGKVVHIDFGDCFEVAMNREKFPERIPFRLTRMLINAMEITGIEGNYRSTCEAVMNVLRQHKDSVMAVLEAFIYDPLLNWRLVEPAGAGRRNAQAPEFGGAITGNDDEPTERARRENEEQPIAAGDLRVVSVINRVRDKLTGRDFDRSRHVDVPAQVTNLIRQATAHENLCQCYIGWCPFW